MKIRRWGWIGFAIALSACGLNQAAQDTAARPDVSASTTADIPAVADITSSDCPTLEAKIPLQATNENELPFERFDFRPTTVTETEDTLTFAGNRYSFTLCKSDRTWGVATVAPAPEAEEDYSSYYENLSNPDYDTISHSNGQTYEARVRLDAAWLEDPSSAGNDLEQVIFEIIKPGVTAPTSQVLYTNTDIIERELGASIGIPTVTRTRTTDDAIWWAIGFEQGEGNSGITTLVQYQIATDEIQLWQPSELQDAQITDLAITGAADSLTLWLGTQYSGEGNPYLPAQGLVAYAPQANTVESYTSENSPLVGAIPTRLWTTDEQLWVATGSGICGVDWATAASAEAWDCWQFSAMAELPAGQPLYASLLADSPMEEIEQTTPVNVLWLADQDIETATPVLRYEVHYQPGITASLTQGADYYADPENDAEDGYFWWPGKDWSWNGQHFERSWDQVALNYVGGGPSGISNDDNTNYVANWLTMRGDFDLIDMTPDSSEIKYYSAWIDADTIEPWLTVTAANNQTLDTPNPTDPILAELKQADN